MLCAQSSLASQRVVRLEVTNEILSAWRHFSLLSVSVVPFVRLVRVCSFEGFTLSSPLHLISPVMAAALLSPCFHAGPVHGDEWSVGGWMIIYTGGASGSGTAWSGEQAAPPDDGGGV